MRKRTIVSVLALLNLVWETMTEFGLILVLVVEPLYSIMCTSAFVLLRALLCVRKLT